jgi:hypothetical protein
MLYRIVSAETLELLEREVQSYLAIGWAPLGGVTVGSHRAGHLVYAQAITYSNEPF